LSVLPGQLFQVIDVRNANTSSVEYRVHYAGWNTRYDEWIKSDAISSVIDNPAADAVTPMTSKQKQLSAAAVILFCCLLLLLVLKYMLYLHALILSISCCMLFLFVTARCRH